ncbi:hypothetical protein EVAR_59768_1 [Eumeta japonica]|uniref:Uncharacterized protein n=1 Tax=Eumeta variegata TaxID=151549 RepID=A0A4C1ZE98_EUMVA|nr:hypothetical protein EVAR_59768_1 [Eumeta japonica]
MLGLEPRELTLPRDYDLYGVGARARAAEDGEGTGGCVRPLSLFYSDASADGVEERSLVPRSRSHARLRRNATMSHAFSLRLGVTYENVTLGNVTMSHRTREARRMPCVSLHSTMIGLPRAALEN